MDILLFYGQANGYHIYQPIQGMTFENYGSEEKIISFIYKDFSYDFDIFKEFLRYL